MLRFMTCILCGGLTIAFAQVKLETSHMNPDYVLGPGDQLRIHESNVPELPEGPIALGGDGSVALPLVGRVVLAGMTSTQAEAELGKRYKDYLVRPDISVSVVEYLSQPVSVLGSVRTPGVQQVRGNRTLVEMLSLAGGLAPDAGSRLKISRRVDEGPLPLANAQPDPTGQFMIAEVDLKALMEARNPADNISVKPNDVLTVPASANIYVLGHVLKAGPFQFDGTESMTALQAVSLAGGMDHTAQPKNARILRRMPGQPERVEIALNLQEILDGRSGDVRLQPEDILLVPNNVPKSAALKALEVAIQMGTGVVIWRRY